jgi:hypothetical protein
MHDEFHERRKQIFSESKCEPYKIHYTKLVIYIKMISTSFSILHRNVPRIAVSTVFKRQIVLSSSCWDTISGKSYRNDTFAKDYERWNGWNISDRYCFSSGAAATTAEIRGIVSDGVSTSHEMKQKSPGHVTHTLRVLDMDVVRKILDELKSVDLNADGR